MRRSHGTAAAALLLLLGLAVPAAADTSIDLDAELDAIRSLRNAGAFRDADERVRALLAEVDTTGADPSRVTPVLETAVGLALRLDRDDVLSLAERLVAISEDDASRARALAHLGQVRHRRHEYEEAFELLQRSVTMSERAAATDADLALPLKMLANVYVDLGRKDEAEAAFERVLAMDLDEGPVARAALLYNYGRLLADFGRLRRAAATYSSALDLVRGSGHALEAYLEHGLASVLVERLDYGPARDHLDRSISAGKSLFGAGHPFVRSAQHDLGLLLVRMGDLSAAEEVLRGVQESLDSADEGRSQLGAATTMHLAEAIAGLGRHDEAIVLFREALAEWSDLVGDEHPGAIACLRLLALTELEAGRADSARSRLARVVELNRRLVGSRAPFTAIELTNLARAELAAGDPSSAREECAEAIEIFEESLGPDSPYAGQAWEVRARAELLDDEPEKAVRHAMRAETIASEHARLTLGYLPEREALHFSGARTRGVDVALAALATLPDPDGASDVWDAVIRSRALVLEEMERRRAALLATPDPSAWLMRYADASRELAWLLVNGPEVTPEYREAISAARARREAIERELAEETRGSGRVADTPGWRELRDALPVDGALVAFVRFVPPGTEASYAAFVVTPGDEVPHLIPISGERDLRRAVLGWRREASEGPFLRHPTDASTRYRRAGEELRRIVWDPLEGSLPESGMILLVPDGLLHLVAFATLPRGDGSYLVESRRRIHYLSSERDVRRPWPVASGRGLLAVGGVEYGPPGDGFLHRFEPLPAAAAEVDAVRATFEAVSPGSDVTMLTGVAATEEAFTKTAPGRAVLHLATHGFFVNDDAAPVVRVASRGIGGVKLAGPPVVAGPLSGLALARANDPGEGEDGILTAEEISALDLAGTRWAVLSACDTGVGEIRSGEGVVGLRRAFEVAGVRTLLLSMWAVDDVSTHEWMERLYEARWRDGLGTAEAVRKACVGLIVDRRRRGASDHPFFWGAFLAAGDWL